MSAAGPTTSVADEIELALDRDVRPGLSAHGGGIELISVDGQRAELRMRGSCDTCYFRRSCVINLVRPVLVEAVGDDLEYHVARVGV